MGQPQQAVTCALTYYWNKTALILRCLSKDICGKYKMRVVLRNLSFSCVCICELVAKGSPHNEMIKNTSTVTPNLIASFNVLCSTFGEGCTTARCVAAMATRIIIVSWEGEVGGMKVLSKNPKHQEQSIGHFDVDGLGFNCQPQMCSHPGLTRADTHTQK